jgi:3-oxoacyl-[acyl-carrier protein] reductase
MTTPLPGALVTGGSSGIGEACVRRLRDAGYGVVFSGSNRQRVDAAQQRLSVFSAPPVVGVVADVTQPGSAERLVREAAARFGGLDVVVTSAGVYADVGIEAMDQQTWQHTIDVNLSGVFWTVQAALPQLRTRSGYVIAIGSISGINGYRGESAYGVSKASLGVLSEIIRIEAQADGVRATVIAPGATRTRMAAQAFRSDRFGANGDEPGLLEVEDIAATVTYLLQLSPGAVVREIVLRASRGKPG